MIQEYLSLPFFKTGLGSMPKLGNFRVSSPCTSSNCILTRYWKVFAVSNSFTEKYQSFSGLSVFSRYASTGSFLISFLYSGILSAALTDIGLLPLLSASCAEPPWLLEWQAIKPQVMLNKKMKPLFLFIIQSWFEYDVMF